MLAKKPEDRYQRASEVAAALAPFTRADTGAPEIVEAVMIAPPAATLPAQGSAAAFAFDTSPVPNAQTLVDAEQPRKSRKSKKARAVPWWQRKWTRIGAVAVLFLIAVIAIASSGGSDPNTPADETTNNASRSATAPPRAKERPKDDNGVNPFRPDHVEKTRVLYVVPDIGVWGPDYTPVVRRLRDSGVEVVTASGRGQRARLAGITNETIAVDRRLDEVNAADYDAIVFCGFRIDEYLEGGTYNQTVGRLIAEMRKRNKLVAAICIGQGVLLSHGVLQPGQAARSADLLREFPAVARRARWHPTDRVVVSRDGADGSWIIVAASQNEAEEFAAAILARLGVDQ
jgi:putative intracellular protease/amidase